MSLNLSVFKECYWGIGNCDKEFAPYAAKAMSINYTRSRSMVYYEGHPIVYINSLVRNNEKKM